MAEGVATPDGPPRRRESWSIKTLVEDIAGRPISDFQDPDRPVHPYLKVKMASDPSRPALRAPPPIPDRRAIAAAELNADPDPVDRVYPPLTGATGRQLHGAALEHHAPTLASVSPPNEEASPGRRPHAPGPSQRPERVYLHYLLLHLDRLNETALHYLRNAVDEELRHRQSASATPPDH